MIKLLPPPLIRMMNYQSTDASNPDVLELKVIGTEMTQAKKGKDVCIYLKQDGKWIERTLRVLWFGSNNVGLHFLWRRNVQKGKLKSGVRFKLLTWIGTTRPPDKRPVRKFLMEF